MAILAKLSVIVLIVVLANLAVSSLIDELDLQIWPEHLETVDRVVVIAVILYICLMAMPFLPGIEIGLILMTMLGPKGVLVAYVCTVIALIISYGLGKVFPMPLLVSLFRWLHLKRAATLVSKFDAIAPENRLEFLAENAPARTLPALLRSRYLVLALLLNLPGNALIGGGGGIAMMAGMSRIYSFPMYVLVLCLAVLPGPLLFMLSKSIPS